MSIANISPTNNVSVVSAVSTNQAPKEVKLPENVQTKPAPVAPPTNLSEVPAFSSNELKTLGKYAVRAGVSTLKDKIIPELQNGFSETSLSKFGDNIPSILKFLGLLFKEGKIYRYKIDKNIELDKVFRIKNENKEVSAFTMSNGKVYYTLIGEPYIVEINKEGLIED